MLIPTVMAVQFLSRGFIDDSYPVKIEIEYDKAYYINKKGHKFAIYDGNLLSFYNEKGEFIVKTYYEMFWSHEKIENKHIIL